MDLSALSSACAGISDHGPGRRASSSRSCAAAYSRMAQCIVMWTGPVAFPGALSCMYIAVGTHHRNSTILGICLGTPSLDTVYGTAGALLRAIWARNDMAVSSDTDM